MRNLIITFLVLLLNVSFCFAEYVPVPKEKSKEYKTEVETLINRKVPVAKKNIDKQIKDARNKYITILKYNLYDDPEKNIQLTTIGDIGIPFELAIIYIDIAKITSKYTQIETTFNTDWYEQPEKAVWQHLIDNKINIKAILNLKQYIYDNCMIIESFEEEIRKHRIY